MAREKTNDDENREILYEQRRAAARKWADERLTWICFETGAYAMLSGRHNFNGKTIDELTEDFRKDRSNKECPNLLDFVKAVEEVPHLTDNLSVRLRDMLGYVRIDYPPSINRTQRVAVAKRELGALEKAITELNHPMRAWLESPEAKDEGLLGQRFAGFRAWVESQGFPEEISRFIQASSYPKPASNAADKEIAAWLIDRANVAFELAEWHGMGVPLELNREALTIYSLSNEVWAWYASHLQKVMGERPQILAEVSPFNQGLGRDYFWKTAEIACQNRNTTRALYEIASEVARSGFPIKSLDVIIRLERAGMSIPKIGSILENIHRIGNEASVEVLGSCNAVYLDGAINDLQHVPEYAAALNVLTKYQIEKNAALDFMYRYADWEITKGNIAQLIARIAQSDKGKRGPAIRYLVAHAERLCSDAKSRELMQLVEDKHIVVVESYFDFEGSARKQELLLTKARVQGYKPADIAAIVEELNSMSDDETVLALFESQHAGISMAEDYRGNPILTCRYVKLVTEISEKSAKLLLQNGLVDPLVRSDALDRIKIDDLNRYLEAVSTTDGMGRLRKRKVLYQELEKLAQNPGGTIARLFEGDETTRMNVPRQPYTIICISQHMGELQSRELSRATGCHVEVRAPDSDDHSGFNGNAIIIYDARYGSHNGYYAAKDAATNCIRFVTTRSTHPDLLKDAVGKALQ